MADIGSFISHREIKGKKERHGHRYLGEERIRMAESIQDCYNCDVAVITTVNKMELHRESVDLQ